MVGMSEAATYAGTCCADTIGLRLCIVIVFTIEDLAANFLLYKMTCKQCIDVSNVMSYKAAVCSKPLTVTVYKLKRQIELEQVCT